MHLVDLVTDAARSPAPYDVPALDRIVRAIEAQPRLMRDVLCATMPADNPPCCALGALLIAAGVPVSLICSIPNEPGGWPVDVRRLMILRYGLRLDHLEAIADANDSASHEQIRKHKVCKRVAGFPGVLERYRALAGQFTGADMAVAYA